MYICIFKCCMLSLLGPILNTECLNRWCKVKMFVLEPFERLNVCMGDGKTPYEGLNVCIGDGKTPFEGQTFVLEVEQTEFEHSNVCVGRSSKRRLNIKRLCL